MADDISGKKAIIECNIYLTIFIVAQAIILVILFCDKDGIDWVSIIFPVNYMVLTYHAYKKRIVPLIIMSIQMSPLGLTAVGFAISILIKQQIILGIVTILMGFSLAYGGIRIMYLYEKVLRYSKDFQPQPYSMKILEKYWQQKTAV